MKRTTIKSVIFCCLVLVLLFSAFGYKAADKADVLPSNIDNGKKSYLEGKALQSFPSFSFSSFNNGSFQEEMEAYAGDCFPSRDNVLIANAAAQRNVIKAANVAFGYSIIPTFFGSSYLYDFKKDTVLPTPLLSEKKRELVSSSLNAFNRVATSNCEVRFLVYLPDRLNSSSQNPAGELMSNAVNTEWIVQQTKLLTANNVDAIAETHNTYDELLEHYYKTDHHWMMPGGYDAYSKIANVLDLSRVSILSETSFEQYPFDGASARSGIDLDSSDVIVDYEYDLPAYTVWIEGKPTARGHSSAYTQGSVPLKQSALNAYAYYFGNDYDRVIYTRNNTEEKTGKRLLLIGDSFTNCMEKLFISSYDRIEVIDPRSYKDLNFSDTVKEGSFDDVILLASTSTLASDVMVSYLTR